MNGVVLVLGGGRWQCDLVQSLKAYGLRTVVADIHSVAPAAALADVFIQVDTNDVERLVEVAATHRVDTVLAEATDRVVPVAAAVNERLGLPGITPSVARVFTDKLAMREALESSGLPMPSYREVASAKAALEFTRSIGLPMVVKPKQSQSSLGVRLVTHHDQLGTAIQHAKEHSADGLVLVEEYIDGPELTVEAISISGKCNVLAISEKDHFQSNPCVAKRLAYPALLPANDLLAVQATAKRVVESLGLQDGVSHAEYRLRDGVPYLIEVAARGGGNRIASMIVPHVSGVDTYRVLAERLFGQTVDFPPVESRAANLEFFDFQPGIVQEVQGIDEVRRRGLAADIDLPLAPGQVLRVANDDRTRSGYFITLAESRQEVDRVAAQVRDVVKVVYREMVIER